MGWFDHDSIISATILKESTKFLSLLARILDFLALTKELVISLSLKWLSLNSLALIKALVRFLSLGLWGLLTGWSSIGESKAELIERRYLEIVKVLIKYLDLRILGRELIEEERVEHLTILSLVINSYLKILKLYSCFHAFVSKLSVSSFKQLYCFISKIVEYPL